METSLGLYLFPELIDMSRAVREDFHPQTSLSPQDLFVDGDATLTTDGSRSSVGGVMGDPTLATASKGARLLDLAAKRLSSFLVEFSQLDINSPTAKVGNSR